ncbi:DMT family transporter [Mycolicibacterium sp. CBM1]
MIGGSSRVLAQFILLALTWGASFLFIKVGLEGLSPAQVVLARLGGGALTLAVLCAATRAPLPRSLSVWAHAGVVGVLLCVLPFLLFAMAEQHITSGLAAIYNASTPLMTMLIATVALPEDRPSGWRVVGLVCGLAGVIVVLSPWQGFLAGSGAAQAACLLATASYGAAYVYLRRFLLPNQLPALVVAAMQVGTGALVMVVLSPAIVLQPMHLSGRVIASMALLGVFGTGLAYIWNVNVVTAWGATGASTVTYLTPLVGVVLGVVVLAEKLAWNQPLGGCLVVIGVALTRIRGPVQAESQATLPG